MTILLLLWLAPGSSLAQLPRAGIRTNLAAAAVGANPRTNLAPAALRTNPRTNLATVKTNFAAGPARAVGKTNAPPAAQQSGTKGASRLTRLFRRFQASPAFYPGLVVAALFLGLAAVYLSKLFQSKPGKTAPATPADQSPPVTVRPFKTSARKASFHSCNVLQFGAQTRQLWQFDARSSGFVLSREQSGSPKDALPGSVTKDWRSLWQRKLNVAWLPPENIFLRVAQFPQSEFAETFAMVELQLEKLSPMPVGQIVWSLQVVAHAKGNMQTVIVMIAARAAVEEFLGQLEGQGYLADRLELPLLDQLLTTTATHDGAWIYPEVAGGKSAALVAWWYGGVLQDLALINLPAANRPASLKEQLLQMAWAGEMAGWLTGPPRWHLVADAPTAGEWEPALREGLEQPVEVLAPLPAPRLAGLTAKRSAHAEPQANLLPAEFSTRYQQQFHDRLWMRGLGALVALYLLGVLYYFVRLEVALYFTRGVEQELAAMGPHYTNATQIRARYQVLKDRQDLKFAALDCWKAVAELMPEGLTLDSWHLTDGKKLLLTGTAPGDQGLQIIEFDRRLRKEAMSNGQPLFDVNEGEHPTQQANAGGTTVRWTLSLVLKRSEAL